MALRTATILSETIKSIQRDVRVTVVQLFSCRWEVTWKFPTSGYSRTVQLEWTYKNHQVQPPNHFRVNSSSMLLMVLSQCLLNTDRHGTSTALPAGLFYHWTAFRSASLEVVSQHDEESHVKNLCQQGQSFNTVVMKKAKATFRSLTYLLKQWMSSRHVFFSC